MLYHCFVILYPSFRCRIVLYNIIKYNSLSHIYHPLRGRPIVCTELGRILYGPSPILYTCYFHFIFLWAFKAKPVFCQKVGQARQNISSLIRTRAEPCIWSLCVFLIFTTSILYLHKNKVSYIY